MAARYVGDYNYDDIFGDKEGKDRYKPSYLRDVTRIHFYNNDDDARKTFISEREDQYEGFFSQNFQNQIEERTRKLGYEDRERITREAVFEQANYNYTNKVLNNTGSIFNRLFNAFQTPDLFESSDQSAMFGREVLHEFTNYLKQPANIRELPATSIPLPARELDYKFEQSIQNSINSAQQASRHINKDIADFQRRNASTPSDIDYWTNGGVTRGKRLLDNVGYINRPGILPAIGMIHDAGSELSINIFQLQNKPIIDYLTADLQRRADKGENFKLNVMLAWNEEVPLDDDGMKILGSNIVAIRTFQALKEKYEGQLDINIFTNDKRNHTKLLFSDTGAYISTQNQTGPVGKSLYQAGSNYETGRYVRNLAIDSENIKDRAEGKIYQQIKQVHNRMFGANYEQRILSTGLPNVGAAVETYEVLKSSLAYLHQANSAGRQVRADFILDQVFLLQHDSLLFDKVAEGEMGPESKHMLDRLNSRSEYGRKKQLYRSELQAPFLKALIEGTVTATVDPRNYRKDVQEPIFSSLMGNRDYIDSGYDLTKYLGIDPNSNMKAEDKIQYVMNTKGFTRDKAIQLLAIESGNIQPANVPRQHVKAFTMYELNSSERGFDYNGRKITPLGDSTNSSNMGLHSTGEGDTVNNELGTYHLHPNVRASSDVFRANKMDMTYALSTEEEYIELVDHTRNILTMKDDLSVRRVNGQLQYTNVNNRAEYERSTDRAKLTELFSQLDAMNKASGSMMTVGYDFDNYGPIAVKVEVNSQLNYKFTYGQGFISEVNKSLVIGNSEFINQSSSAINLGFNQTVGVGERITLSPIQTTMSMISSIALESEQIKLIRAPLIEYRENYAPGLDGNNSFDTGLGKYLLNLSGYGDRLTNEVLHKGIVDETSVVIGALTNLQARMRNTDPTLDKVRQLAGIDINSQTRLANIEYLNDLIGVFAKAGTDRDRRAVLTGEGLQAGTPNIKSFMATLFHSPEYADLLYDFVNSQGDPLYKQSVNKYVKEVSTRVYDPYLNRTQVSTYSSTQAYRQRPVYGVNQRREGFADSINRASAETQANLTKLGAFALAASPFEHDATSDLGKGTSLLYMPITGTGGSREKSGLEYSGYHNYAALHPYFQHKKIGTVTVLDIIQDAGVGSIITRKGIGDYNQAITHLGLTVNADDLLGEGEDTLLLFNFDVRKKASQIPQRIKNVIGSRPTRELTEVYQNLVERHDAFYKGLDGKGRLQVNSIDQLQQAYLTDLRNSVGDKRHLIDDSYSVGIEEGGQIRATLSSDLAEVLERVREDINNEFEGVDESTRSEILRVRLVQADRSAHAIRGFIGSSKRQGDSVVLFQLSGAYSDYSILNPEFGGENGMRTTFSDRAVKGQKSSQISSQRLMGEVTDFHVAKELLVASGSLAKQDEKTGLFHIYSFDEATNQYIPGQVVSSRKEASLYNNLLEAVRVDPTIGNLNFTSNAASFDGVHPIEILKDIRILESGVESNEIRVELNFNRSQKGGGGGRQESLSGGLVKIVPIYLSDLHKDGKKTGDGLLRIMFNQFNEERAGSFADSKLNFHQFYGVVNPSNLKSYFYEHGAKILIDQDKKNALLNTDGQKLAASLIMAFGTSKFGNLQLEDVGALDALGKAAASGSLGTFYKDQYVLNYIQSKGDESKVNEAFVKSVKNISSLQVRTLDYIDIDLVTQALTGDKASGKLLQDRLKTLLSDPHNNVVKPGEYVDIGKDRGRELSILAASLDYFVQLTEAKPHDIAVLDATKDNVAYRSLGTIGGLSYDDLNKEEERNLVNQLGRRSYVVGMRMSMSSSQSKVTISSKLDSFIENQHLIWEPFYTDAKKFKGGALSSLRQLMAGFFGAMTGTHSGQYSNSVTNLQQIDILSPHARGAVFKSAMLGVYNDPGVDDTKFKELQRNYEMFEALHSVSELGNVDLIEKIIKVYRTKSDGLDIEPDKLNTHLDNIVKAAKGEGGNLTKLIDQGRYYAFNHFERMYADFRLDPAKRTNAGQAISSGLQRSAGSMGRFAFTFPHLEFTDDRVKVYKNAQQHSFSLAGEDMKIIGESYGAINNPLQKSQLIVWQAFAPGSAVGKIFDRIAASTDKVFSINDLSEEDHNKLSEFYTNATLYPDELAEALGVFANKTVGGSKLGFAGGTTTPAAWFMGSTTATILPEAILARHGGGNTRRMRVHQSLVERLGVEENNQFTKFLRESINPQLDELGQLQNRQSELYNLKTQYKEEKAFVEFSEAYLHLQGLYSYLKENKESINQIESNSGYIRLQQLYSLKSQYKANKESIESSNSFIEMQRLFDLRNKYKSNKKSIENSETYIELQKLYEQKNQVKLNRAEIESSVSRLQQSDEVLTYVTKMSDLTSEKARLETELQPYWDLNTQFKSEKEANKKQLTLIEAQIKTLQESIAPYLNEKESYTIRLNELGYIDKKGNIKVNKSVEDGIYSDYFSLIKEHDNYYNQIDNLDYQSRRLGKQVRGLTYEINKLTNTLDYRRLTPYQTDIYNLRREQLIDEVNLLHSSMSQIHLDRQTTISDLQIFKSDIYNPLMYERKIRLAEIPTQIDELHNLIIDIDFQIHPQLEQIRKLQQQQKDLLSRNRQLNNELNELRGNKGTPGFISSQEESLRWVNQSIQEAETSWKGSFTYGEIRELNAWLTILNKENSLLTSEINVYRGDNKTGVAGFLSDDLLLLDHYRTQLKAVEDRLNYYRGQKGEVYGSIENDILLQKHYSQKLREVNNEINKITGNDLYVGTLVDVLPEHRRLKAENKLIYSLIESRKDESTNDFEWYSKVKEELSQINKELNEWVNPAISQIKESISPTLGLLKSSTEVNNLIEKRFLTSAINTLNRGISGDATVELNQLLEASKAFKDRIDRANGDQSTLSEIIKEIEGKNPESKQSIGFYRGQLNVKTIKDKDGNSKQVMGVRLNEGGDSFVSLLGLYEMRALRAEALSKGGYTGSTHIIGTNNQVSVDKLIEQANTYKSLISPIDGLLVGSNNKDSIYVTPEELAGEMRRGSSKLENSLGLTYKSIAGLEGDQGAAYLRTIVEGVNKFATDSIGKLEETYKLGESRALAQGTIDRLTEMRTAINSYNERINSTNKLSKHEVADLALFIQTDVERYHAEIMTGSTLSMRPMPMGNSFSGRAMYDVFGLTNLNNLMSEYGLPISFTPVGGDNRNKTLHLFNPHSWLASHLGDFDGDMMTNMFRSSNQLSLKVNSYNALIENVDIRLVELKNSLTLVAEDESKQAELTKSINELENKRKDYEGKRTELRGSIENITKHESVKEYQIAAAKWVGNYLKVDHRVFLGSELGGFRKKDESLPPEVLFTFTEQGRGLFGGMEGIVSKSKDLFNDIYALANKVDNLNNISNLDEVLQVVTHGSGLDVLLQNKDLSKGFLSDLADSIDQAKGNKELGAAIHTANLFAAQGGAEAIQKYNLKGIDGASMTPAIFEAMEHTLGQAGSVILGKSYNTMVGMLYTEAPSLAMSYAVLNDPGNNLKDMIESSQSTETYKRLYDAAVASRTKSEGMGSFLQATQQILRDSIKPKDAIGYLDELDAALKNYKDAKEGEGRSLAYQSIVEKFGPGPGLKALIEMESLVLDSDILNSRGNTDNDISKRSKTLEKYELTSHKMTELEARLGYNSTSGGFDRLSPEVNNQIKQYRLTKEYVLAAYKTKQDMVSVISDFAFDKGYNSGDSTGFSMRDAFSRVLESNSGLDINKINYLSDVAHGYVGSNDKLTYLAGLDSESQAFIEALTSRGLGKVESLSPSEEKFNKLWSEDLTSRQYAAHTWMETNKQFGYTVGEFGEMFIRFGAFNQARREAYSSSEDVRETYSGLDDPLAIAQLMAMTNGKVDPSMVGNLFNSLANAARNQTGNPNPTMAEIYRGIGVGAGLNETDADRTMKGILLNSTDEVQAHLLGVARTMSIGQQAASIQDYVNSSQQNYEKAMSYEILKAHYESLGSKDNPKFTPEEAEILARQAMVQSYSVASTSSSPAYSRPIKPNRIGKVLGSLGTDSDVKAQGFLFPLLGLVGAALSTGDLTPEAFQMAAGTALQNLSYVRWSNLEKNFKGTAANVMAGTAFKMRLALQESEGDAGKALWAATARELTMAGVATAVNTFAPKYIDRMLGGGETLDFDKYQSGRNLLTSTLSAVVSTVIGMAINNNVVNRMVSPDASYVSKELAAINQQNLKAFNTTQEESEEGVTVEGVDGDLVYKQLHTWANDDDYQLGIDVSESINFAFNTEPNTVYEFQLSDG